MQIGVLIHPTGRKGKAKTCSPDQSVQMNESVDWLNYQDVMIHMGWRLES